MTDRLWTLTERRVQLAELVGHALWIKQSYDTDAYDDIVAQCQRFSIMGSPMVTQDARLIRPVVPTVGLQGCVCQPEGSVGAASIGPGGVVSV